MARSKTARARKKAERKQDQPDAYDPWEHRPDRDRARPTDERRQRGEYRLGETRDAGVRVAIDDASTPLRRAYMDAAINRGQLEAGERFEALARASVPRGPRSCLDWMPPGSSETETEYQVRSYRAWIAVCRHIGMIGSMRLLDVCVFHQATGPRRRDLRKWCQIDDALDAARDFWGIPKDETQQEAAPAK